MPKIYKNIDIFILTQICLAVAEATAGSCVLEVEKHRCSFNFLNTKKIVLVFLNFLKFLMLKNKKIIFLKSNFYLFHC